jgi:hypothetical protein
LQHRVADRVSVPVVDRLEVIEVEGKHADRRHGAAVAGQERAGGVKKSAAIQQAGHGSVVAAVL